MAEQRELFHNLLHAPFVGLLPETNKQKDVVCYSYITVI